PEKIKVKCNANIIKNANGVTVPNSGNLKGIKAAAILGAIGGNPDKKLKVLTDIGENEIKLTKSLLKTDYCNIELIESKKKLHIIIEVSFGEEITQVEVVNGHLNIIEIIKNGEIIFNKQKEGRMANEFEKIKDSLKVENIINYAENIDLEEVRIILQRQINLNKNISQEGLNQEYGLNIGSTILRYEEDSTKNRAKSAAAAASDARMSGSFLPVIINSGSGNQGITVSLPVVEYAKDLGVKSPKLLRALIISNLISIHLKHKIGILSAFCGAVTAAAGSGAAITYLCGRRHRPGGRGARQPPHHGAVDRTGLALHRHHGRSRRGRRVRLAASPPRRAGRGGEHAGRFTGRGGAAVSNLPPAATTRPRQVRPVGDDPARVAGLLVAAWTEVRRGQRPLHLLPSREGMTKPGK
ncbi:MAG: L-serine ammonia-lyase, iron-sulfur-dependent, subunit alpha, partial [Dehalococcoidales bacterium]